MEKTHNSNLPFKNPLFLTLIPVVILIVVLATWLRGGPSKIFETSLPPVEELHVSRHLLKLDEIILDVVNTGPDPVTVAQVMVRGAFWYHEMSPTRELKHLEKGRITIPYPWNPGEPIMITLLTSTGLTFEYEIEVASLTPQVTRESLMRFGLLGVYVGLIPVILGMFWFPFLKRLGPQAIAFLLYFTVGLLAFLAVDTLMEGFHLTQVLPEVFHSSAIFLLGIMGIFLVLLSVEHHFSKEQSHGIKGVYVAWLIAFGIGLHNLGEGLAIGSSYVLGEVTLGTMLIVGFTLHNITEGIAIIVPILKSTFDLRRLALLGLLAGAPTIVGCWIGAFTYSQILSILFLGIGTGAIIQVIIAIMRDQKRVDLLRPFNLLGLFLGYMVMYLTGLLV